MRLTVLEDHPDARLAGELNRFEEQFSYPLGDGGRFRIAHGGDGWRFFHALGEAAYAVVGSESGVLGVAGAALRRVVQPDDAESTMLYLGDLKIAAEARGGMVLVRLARALQSRFQGRTSAAFAVVMDGTAMTPAAYTGRMGIPAFVPVAAITILWLRTGDGVVPTVPATPVSTVEVRSVAAERGLERFAELARGQYRLPHAEPTERSLMAPQWLVAEDGGACGRLEDTLRAKRLRTVAGEDMRSAHLSCFAYRRLSDGLRLLRAALERSAQAGYPLLFVAVTPADAVAIAAQLSERVCSLAGATVFATGLAMTGRWNINTAEI